MQQVLVYSDSLSWGIIPGTRERLPFDQRWPGVMELELARRGVSTRVIEDCLNGRRTVWEDPYKPGRNGLLGLEQRIEVNSPLALVVLQLGTNDFQSVHNLNAWQSAQGVAALVAAVRRAPIEPGMPDPQILVVAPPSIQAAKGEIAFKFEGAESKAAGLSDAIETVAASTRCHFFDAATACKTSRVDGVHLDVDQHELLGLALAAKVQGILISNGPS